MPDLLSFCLLQTHRSCLSSIRLCFAIIIITSFFSLWWELTVNESLKNDSTCNTGLRVDGTSGMRVGYFRLLGTCCICLEDA
jgi:hypothetical protein